MIVYLIIIAFAVVSIALWAFILWEKGRFDRYRSICAAALPTLTFIKDHLMGPEIFSSSFTRESFEEGGEVLQFTGATEDGTAFKLTSESRGETRQFYVELRRPEAEPIIFSVSEFGDELGDVLASIFASASRCLTSLRDQIKGPSGKITLKIDEIRGEHLN